jgi:hypothetical protein
MYLIYINNKEQGHLGGHYSVQSAKEEVKKHLRKILMRMGKTIDRKFYITDFKEDFNGNKISQYRFEMTITHLYYLISKRQQIIDALKTL